MRCPNCDASLSTVDYEGIEIDSCAVCGGDWLERGELGKIVRIREQRFSPEELDAIDAAAKIPGIPYTEIEREIPCPSCGVLTGPINYGGDTGIIINRCSQCEGIWVDRGELDNIQILAETWKDNLPDDLRKYGPKLEQVAREIEERNRVVVSDLPYVAKFINAVINGILDLTI